MKKKKILFLIPSFIIGGIERALINLVENIDYKQYDVYIKVFNNNFDILKKYNLSVHIEDCSRESNTRKYPLLWLYKFLQKKYIRILHSIEVRLYLLHVFFAVNDRRYDAVIGFSHWLTWKYCIMSLFTKKHIIYFHHGAKVNNCKDKNILKKVDNLVVVSNGVKKIMDEVYPKDKKKIIVINNIIPSNIIKKMSEDAAEVFFDSNNVNIVTCARIEEEKGIDLVIKSIAILKHEGIHNIKWYLAGDGKDKAQMQKMAIEYDVDNNIVFLGSISNPYGYVKGCDIYVQPSYIEAFCISVAEAMVLGKAIVSTATEGVKEFFVDGETGILTDISAEGIAYGIKTIIEKPEVKNEFKRNLEKIDFESYNKKILTSFYEIL